jgi:hypothetical protein
LGTNTGAAGEAAGLTTAFLTIDLDGFNDALCRNRFGGSVVVFLAGAALPLAAELGLATRGLRSDGLFTLPFGAVS